MHVIYDNLTPYERRLKREEYVKYQKGICLFCSSPLDKPVPRAVALLDINWKRLPPNFLKYPVHLQHDHKTGLTEGAVHAYCNAVMWQYYGR